MKKDLIFFSDKGLTSTSANHICNLAKEYIQNTETILNNISFYNHEVELLIADKKVLINEGTKNIKNIPVLLKEIADAKSLIAWLREAIKAKQSLLDECEYYGDVEYLTLNNIKRPTPPEKDSILTEDEYYSNLSVKERNRYYSLETQAAVLGKYIHPDGKYAQARKTLSDYIQNPHEIDNNGRDTIVHTYTPTIPISEIDNLFFQLQQKHREVQAELNSIKYACEQAIIESKAKVQEEYANALREYNAMNAEIDSEIEKYRTNKLKEIGNYKIIIPNSLIPIYEKISKLGK